MKRRILVAWVLLTVICGATISAQAAEPVVVQGCVTGDGEPLAGPNIIFLLTDDQRDNTLGAMGHPLVKTPNLDRLVRQGVRFSNTYIAEPVCSPSRVSLFTGVHERVHGIGFTSSYELTNEQWLQSYPELLRARGYHTGFIGKFGVEYYTFRGRAAAKFDFWRAHDGWAKFFFRDARNCSEYYDSPEEIITPAMGESMERFLDAAPSNRPFCLSVSFSVPHGSQTKSMYLEDAAAVAMKIPSNRNPKLKGHPFYDALYRDAAIHVPDDTGTDPYRFIPRTMMDQGPGPLSDAGPGARTGRNVTYSYDYDRGTCLEHHIRYYQQISGLDHVIGELTNSLGRRGLADNTVILFASDHGLIMGEYGMGGKALLYDLASKIPCFVYDPHLPENQRGRTLDQLVSSLDITATILDYAGVTQPEIMEGRSLRPLVEGGDVPWREELFLESLYTGRDNPFSEGIRRGRWKYIRMYDGVTGYLEEDVEFSGRDPEFEQLFDLETDPGERHNLIAEHEGTELLEDLRRRCQAGSENLNQLRARYRTQTAIQKR